MAPDDPVLAADRTYTHGDLLTASRRVVEEYGLTEEDAVTIGAPLTNPGTLVAGVIAPMRVGASVLLGPGQSGTVAVGDDESAPDRVIDPDGVL